MKDKQGSSRRGKSITVGLVICFVAAIALVGTYTFKHYKDGVKQQLALAEKENKAAENTKEDRTEAANSSTIDNLDNKTVQEAPVEEAPEVSQAPVAAEEPSAGVSVTPKEILFSETDTLIWPVEGNILLNFSMDKTVYFSTLDQYKYNPAVVIAGVAGSEVLSAARGTVKAVETNAQTGNTVTMDLGGGYEAVYGQLADVQVAAGDVVNSGTAIATLAEPTKYYSVEGCNLYFQLSKEGTPVNPLSYLDN